MANTFGQSKANEESAWQNNKEMNPQENSSVTDDQTDENDTRQDSWRPTDEKLESPTSDEFDSAEAAKRNQNIESETPGLHPDIAD